MMSDPRESAVPGLAALTTGEPFWSRVMESPGVAPVSHASSTEPLPWSDPPPDAPAAGAPTVTADPSAREANSRPAPNDARTRRLPMVPLASHDVGAGSRRCVPR